uniref:Uncharacterized protein n=1 Tax=Lotus japonicus TaxID=34305 RepID=I3SJQ8_LOTJA|nr:unknown [Lotus japonicus]
MGDSDRIRTWLPSLLLSSTSSNLEMRSTASGLKVSGRCSFLFAILATVSSSFSLHDPNGISPRNIKYIKTPNAHQSAGKPCPFPKTISGASESAIPQTVNVLSSESFFPNLKSTSCIRPVCPNIKTSGDTPL